MNSEDLVTLSIIFLIFICTTIVFVIPLAIYMRKRHEAWIKRMAKEVSEVVKIKVIKES